MTMANHDCPDITDESTVEDVVLHILRLRLGQHTFSDVAETFREEFVNGKVFVRLGKQDLNDLGIFQFQRRKALFDHIQTLRLKQELHGTSEVFTFDHESSRSQSITNNSNHGTQPENKSNSFASFLDDELDALHLNYSSLDVSPHTITHTIPRTVEPDLSMESMNVSTSSDFNTFPFQKNVVSTLGYSKVSKSTNSTKPLGPLNPMMQIRDPHGRPVAVKQSSLSSLSISRKKSEIDPKSETLNLIDPKNVQMRLLKAANFNPLNPHQHHDDQQMAIRPNLMTRHRSPSRVNGVNRAQFSSSHCISDPNKDQFNMVESAAKTGKWKNILMNKENENGNDNKMKTKLLPKSKMKTKSLTKSTVKSLKTNATAMGLPNAVALNASIKSMNPKLIPNSASYSSSIPTESYRDNLVPRFVASENTAKFVAVFRGINVAKFIYLLMDPTQIKQLDAIVSKRGKQELKPAEWISMGQRGGSKIQRSFHSKLEVKYVSDGWMVGNNKSTKLAHMPFNPVCVFTLDLNRNEVVDMSALSVAGHVHNVRSGAMWITSSLCVLATEHRTGKEAPDKCGDIVDIALVDNRKMQLDPLKVSYMVQDHVYSQHKNRTLQAERVRVRCCLKLSTRTNKRMNGSSRQVYIQSWNVRPGGKRRANKKN